MSTSGGGLPQRPPRANRRLNRLPSSPTHQAAPANCSEASDETMPDSKPGAGTSRSSTAAEDGSGSATRDPLGSQSFQISDRHTDGALRSARVGNYKFEYLDHTADVQLHAWGISHAEAFEQVALAMFNYMTPLEGIEVRDCRTIRAKGHDMDSLLFDFLNELLFMFFTDFFVPAELSVEQLDLEQWSITATGRGEVFDRQRHTSGCEVKAITYSAMAVKEQKDDVEIFVIVDI